MTATDPFAGLPTPGPNDHNWTKVYQQFKASGDVAGYIAYLQGTRGLSLPPGTGTGGTGGTGTPPPATGAAGGPGAVPIPAPQPITMPALNYSGRFGDYSAPSYSVGTSYAGNESPPPFAMPGGSTPPAAPPGAPGTPPPSPLPTPTPTPTPQPAPSPAPAPAPSPQPAPQPGGGWGGRGGGGLLGGGNGSGMGGGGLLRSGGQGAPPGIGSGTTAASTQGQPSSDGGWFGGMFQSDRERAAAMPNSLVSGGDPAYDSLGSPVDLGEFGSGLLQGASLLPGLWGVPASLAQYAARGVNTAHTDSQRANLGVPGLDFGQALGGVLGLNSYGATNGNRTIANPEQGPLGMAITTGGLYDPGMFSSYQGALTPGEESTKMQYKTSLPSLKATANQVAAMGNTQGTPITRGDGTVIGYMKPDGTASSPAAQAAMNSGAAGYGVGGTMASTAAMGGGYNGSHSAGTGGIGSGTGLSGGGQGERAGFHSGGYVRVPHFASGGRVPPADDTSLNIDWSRLPPKELDALLGTIEPMPPETTRRRQDPNEGVPMYQGGGRVAGQQDNAVDNRPIMADEGEFVIQRPAAKALGRGLLSRLNDPKQAKKIRGLLSSAA